MTVKINKLEIENVKRVKAVKVEPTQNGLTIIGGNNNQGKTSVLDAIAWALGGNKFRPSNPKREESVIPPTLKITLSNGLIVERKGKNSDLKITDPSGQKAGQSLLDSFVEELALNLPKFMESNNKDKANILLQIIGVEQELNKLTHQFNELYQERLVVGRDADRKKKFAEEQLSYSDIPKELISAKDLIDQQQEILARNGENQRKREKLSDLAAKKNWKDKEVDNLKTKIAELNQQLAKSENEQEELAKSIEIGTKTVAQLQDESTEELENSIANTEEINRKIRANLDKEKAEADAQLLVDEYEALSASIDEVRKAKADLLNSADLPLPGLSVVDGELTYRGQKWDNMSGSEQLKVSTAIVRKLKPDCGFVLLDKLEQMDQDTLNEFGKWLEQEGLQGIATRVSTGKECSIIIQDGYVVGEDVQEEPQVQQWQPGQF